MRRMETHITFQEGISQERKALIRGLIKRDLRKGGHKMSQEGINAWGGVLGGALPLLIQRDLKRRGHIIKEQGRKLSMSRMEGDEFGVGGVKSEGRWKSIGFRLSHMRKIYLIF